MNIWKKLIQTGKQNNDDALHLVLIILNNINLNNKKKLLKKEGIIL